MNERVLVIAAHPDDGALGCGGAIARYIKEGKEAYLCIVTRVYTPDWTQKYLENRDKQIDASNKILGIKKTLSLDFPAVKLDTVPQKKLNDALTQVIREVAPELVYIPHMGDLNRDHRLVFEASLVATRPVGNAVKGILSYETLSTTEWGQVFAPFVPNVYIDITETFDTKLKAVAAYADEIRAYPHPRSPEAVKALAQKRGSEAGVALAEAFTLIRELR